MTAVYGPNQSSRWSDLWSEILRVRSLRSGPWVIGGVFNVVKFLDEKNGGHECPIQGPVL